MKVISEREAIDIGLRPRNIFSVRFPQSRFTKQSAIHWLRSRNYKFNNFRETADELIFQQNAQEKNSTMYSIHIDPYNVAVILQSF